MLNELTGLLRLLQDDLRMRVTEKPELLDGFQPRYEAMLRDKRTAAPLESWLEGEFTQIAVHWILACVFIRYCEDQALIEETYISGPNGKWRDGQEALTRYFRQFPAHSEREYLLHVFQAVSSLPALSELFHQRHNPLWSLGPSGDACRELLNTFQRTDENGQLVLRFDTLKTTRFLGDLYQDLSEYAKKQFALLQTPDFVESFILDHTLEPALASFGYQQTKLIDPTCGSGHFLIGGFQRLLREVRLHEPALNPIAQVQKALSGVFGVDINPFAVAIAHFRLIVEALRESGVRQLKAAPAFQINLARGDSLFHKELDGLGGDTLQMELLGEGKFDQYYESEDTPELRRILFQKYEAVVGNPPYITVKDANLNKAYRHKYRTCHMKYSMGVPFTERFFELARRGERGAPAGYMGVITTNSFMKREFGVKLIQEYLPKLQLNAIIDTSGAYIPGHGTPTVILFGQNQAPHSDQILVLQGIKGEPSTPDDPSQGLVWCDILHGYNQKQFAGEFISAGWNARSQFASHPWSLTGGGADEVQKTINDSAKMLLHDVSLSIGFGAILGEDDAFTARINSIKSSLIKPLVPGEVIRDWVLATCLSVIFPYDEQNDFKLVPLEHLPFPERFWKLRTYLFDRKDFSKKTYREIGRPYFEYHQIPTKRYRNPLSIAFAFVASHNHFVLDRGGKVFKQTAPVIKLPDSASLADHLALLGLLNSSSACFWMKQTCFNKGGGGAVWAERFEHDGSKLLKFPVPDLKPLDLATRLDRLASELAQVAPETLLSQPEVDWDSLNAHRQKAEHIHHQMIALQEELDWFCYHAYGLTEANWVCDDPPPLRVGERAFEIIMAQNPETLDEAWFSEHHGVLSPDLPSTWPKPYRELVEKRLELIDQNAQLALLEVPNYKRRWVASTWQEQFVSALNSWLLDQVEHCFHGKPQFYSIAELSDLLIGNPSFRRGAELKTGRSDFDLFRFLSELLDGEAVPLQAAARYKESGLRQYALWQQTWALQRQEDALDARAELPETDPQHLNAEALKREKAALGTIPVPPKYKSSDFLKPSYWTHRGKLDVPKERFNLLFGAEREQDPSPVIGWAGWDHLQTAQAIAALYQQRKTQDGWDGPRLLPILVALHELLPWLKQWHNAFHPEFQLRLGDYFEGFVQGECRDLDLSIEDLNQWRPETKKRGHS